MSADGPKQQPGVQFNQPQSPGALELLSRIGGQGLNIAGAITNAPGAGQPLLQVGQQISQQRIQQGQQAAQEKQANILAQQLDSLPEGPHKQLIQAQLENREIGKARQGLREFQTDKRFQENELRRQNIAERQVVTQQIGQLLGVPAIKNAFNVRQLLSKVDAQTIRDPRALRDLGDRLGMSTNQVDAIINNLQNLTAARGTDPITAIRNFFIPGAREIDPKLAQQIGIDPALNQQAAFIEELQQQQLQLRQQATQLGTIKLSPREQTRGVSGIRNAANPEELRNQLRLINPALIGPLDEALNSGMKFEQIKQGFIKGLKNSSGK